MSNSLFYGFFSSLVGGENYITVELKNDMQLTGILDAVDPFLNIKLKEVSISKAPPGHPLLAMPLRSCFVRGSIIRYIHLSGLPIDTEALQAACRKTGKTVT